MNWLLFYKTISDPFQKELVEEDNTAEFWYSKEEQYPALTKVALSTYTTPVPSSASERDISLVNRIFSERRTMLTGSSVEDLVYVKSMWPSSEEGSMALSNEGNIEFDSRSSSDKVNNDAD